LEQVVSTSDDATAIRRSLREPEAFEALFDRHFTAVHRYVRHCLDADAAEDLAAEAFVRAFAARGRYVAKTEDARPWLFAIATNLVRDEVRRRRRAGGLDARLTLQRPGAADPEPLPDAELRDAVMALREQEREVLVLFAWAELSYEEIAAATGTPVGTVRSRLSRARNRLRALLEVPAVPAGGSCDG
jgi:RNA polymerase sigma-70 factor (ECF subfamily)